MHRNLREEAVMVRRPTRTRPAPWAERYVTRFYRSRPGWVDGTTQFHELCACYIRKGARVCEVGAGPSNLTSKVLSTLTGRLVGLDVDPRVMTENEFLRHAVVYDGKVFPFPSSSFDTVVADYVHEHLPDPLGLSREIHRVLVDGGTLIFRTPNRYHYVPVVAQISPAWVQKSLANSLRAADQSETHPTYYRCNSASRIRRLLGAAGFQILHMDFIEKEPSYGMSSRAMFLMFMAYERLVNATPRLAWLRSNILCVARKPERMGSR